MKKVRFQQTLVVCKGLPCLAFPVTFFVVCTDFDDDATVQSWIFFAPKELGWRSDNVGMLMKVKDVGVEVWFCFLSRYIRNNWWAKHHAMICANATLDRIIAFFPEPFLKTDCVWDILGPSPAIADLCSATEKQRWRSAGSNTSKSCFMQRDSMVTWIFQPFLGSSENTKLQTYTLSQSIRWSCDQVLQRQVLGDFILCLLWKFPISSENKPTSIIIIRQKQSRHTHNNYIQKMHLRILQNKAKTVKEIVWVAPFPKKWRLFGSPWMAKVVPPVNNPWIGGLKLCSQVPVKSSFRKRREGECFPWVDPGRVCAFFCVFVCEKCFLKWIKCG